MKKAIFGCVGVLILCALLLIFGGAITFGLGYVGGLLLKWICGQPVADGLNMVLGNITKYEFTPNDIPLFVAIMTTIGGFFKSSVKHSSSDD